MTINLGDSVSDSITGFAGTVIGRTEYLNGCIQFLVQPNALQDDGQPVEGVWFDSQRLGGEADSGGPQPTPSRRPQY